MKLTLCFPAAGGLNNILWNKADLALQSIASGPNSCRSFWALASLDTLPQKLLRIFSLFSLMAMSPLSVLERSLPSLTLSSTGPSLSFSWRTNFLDFGLTAGFHYFLNKGFFVGLTFDYGIPDLTNNDVDFSLKELNPDNSFKFSDDKDSHFGIQASFGFRF